jgi:transcriptional regulator with XRE-family HTH domain
MITGLQIRLARNALRWTTEQLAKKAGVTARTIKRFEAVDDVPPSCSSTLLDVKGLWKLQASSSSDRPLIGPGSVSRELRLGRDEGRNPHDPRTLLVVAYGVEFIDENGVPQSKSRLC